jgi:hypothetical protein
MLKAETFRVALCDSCLISPEGARIVVAKTAVQVQGNLIPEERVSKGRCFVCVDGGLTSEAGAAACRDFFGRSGN